MAAEAMMDRFVDAWNRADGDAYGQNYWTDAELVDPTGTIWSGRTAIAGMHVELWAGPFRAAISMQNCAGYVASAQLAFWSI